MSNKTIRMLITVVSSLVALSLLFLFFKEIRKLSIDMADRGYDTTTQAKLTTEGFSFKTETKQSSSSSMDLPSNQATTLPQSLIFIPSETPDPAITSSTVIPNMPFSIQLNGYDLETNSYTYIEFGKYQSEPLLWRILEVDGNEAYLLSERVIEVMDFDSQDNEWKESDINAWLNSSFLSDSFVGYTPSPIINKPGLPSVFLMSRRDLLEPKYGFSSDEAKTDDNRTASISPFVKNAYSSIIHDNDGKLIYYTRDKDSPKNTTSLAAVKSTGLISAARYDRASNGDGVGIRPAIYINIENLLLSEGDGTIGNPYR